MKHALLIGVLMLGCTMAVAAPQDGKGGMMNMQERMQMMDQTLDKARKTDKQKSHHKYMQEHMEQMQGMMNHMHQMMGGRQEMMMGMGSGMGMMGDQSGKGMGMMNGPDRKGMKDDAKGKQATAGNMPPEMMQQRMTHMQQRMDMMQMMMDQMMEHQQEMQRMQGR